MCVLVLNVFISHVDAIDSYYLLAFSLVPPEG